MISKAVLALGALMICVAVPFVSAGQMQLTTYYPAPTGEYQNLQANGTLIVPVKAVGSDTSAVKPGEIWVES